MSTYKTGTVTVTNGSATVTGSGTAWAVALVAGGIFSCAGIAVPIASVTDDTHIVLDYNWPGTTTSGATYSIALENAAAASVVSLNSTLSRVLVQLSLAGITPDASGSLTDRASISLTVANKGFLFLHAEIGVAFAFYRWTGTAWDGPFPVASSSSGGPVSSLAAGTGITVDATNPAVPVINATRPGTAKTTPVDADEVSLFDSAASYVLNRLTWANLKAGLKTYFDTLYTSTALARREVLTANRTYYVRADGSNSNTGLVNSSAGAFLTVQKAIDTVAAIDISTFNVTIQVADGSYDGTCIVNGAWIGSGTVTINGNSTTPANVLLQTTTSQSGVIQCISGGRITVQNFKVAASGGVGVAFSATTGGVITHSNIEFGAVANYHLNATGGGSSIVSSGTTLKISGGCQYHALASAGGYIRNTTATITLTGTPAFSVSFVATGRGGGLIEYYGNTFSGSATGKRYTVSALGMIFSNGGGASYYPGSTAGTTDALGVYG